MGTPVSISVIGALLMIGLCQCKSGTFGEYGIILQAGSTGTKIDIYTHRLFEGQDRPTVQLILSSKHKPGLQDIKKGHDLPEYIYEIYEEAQAKIPHEYWTKTSLYVFISSGIHDKLDMDLISEWFSDLNDGFKFSEKDNIKVLTEQQEGALLWVAANYAQIGLKRQNMLNGLINMGRSSTQLVFKSDDPTANDLCDVQIGDARYRLVVNIFSQFGVDGIYDGITKEVKNDQLRTNPCILTGDTTKDMPGDSDADACHHYTTVFVNGVLKETPMIPENTKFMATGAFVYPGEDIHMFDSNKTVDRTVGLGLYEGTAFDYCQNTFEQVGDWFSIPENQRSNRCYLTVFAPVLLDKLGLGHTKILATNKLGDTIDVAFGAMILEAFGSPMPCATGASKKRSKSKFDTRATRALLLDYLRRAMKDV